MVVYKKIRKFTTLDASHDYKIQIIYTSMRGNNMNTLKVVDFEQFYNTKQENNECEWDSISNIFSKAIDREKISKSQIKKIIEVTKHEVRK